MTFFGAALLTAITSAVLAVGAIITAVYAVLAFRAQSRLTQLQVADLRESLREALERHHDQEAMVRAWQDLGDDPEPAEVFVHVKNISQQSLYDVTIQWWPAPDHGSWDNEEECAKVKSVYQLLPGEVLNDSSDTLGPYACWSVIFRDSAEVLWRTNSGRPEKVAEK